MKPPYTFLLLSCLLHLYSFSGRIEAQNLPRGDTSPKEFIFHTIDTDNGLPENQVRYIKQLKDHRMLIVTVGTITLYDGGSFRSLHSLPRNYMSVVPPYTNCSEQIQNEVWIRNGDKLCILDLETEQLRDHPEAYVTQLTGLKEKIKDVFPDNAGCLWIYTQSDKLYRYCEKEKRLSPVPHRFSSTAFEAITLSEHTYLLLRDGTCVCLGKKDLKPVSDFLLAEKKLATPWFNCSRTCAVGGGFCWGYKDAEGTGHLMYYDTSSRTRRKLYSGPDRFQEIACMHDGKIAVAGYSKFYMFDAKGKLWWATEKLRTDHGDLITGGFPSATVDNQGGLWVNVSNRGLLYYSPLRIRFNTLSSQKFPGLQKGNPVTLLHPYSRNEILVGTSKGALLYHQDHQTFRPYCPQLNEVQYISVSPAPQHELWLCAAFHGAYRIGADEQPVPLTLRHPGGVIPQNIRAICRFPGLGEWMLSKELGAAHFNPQTNELTSLLDEYPELNQIGLITHAVPWDAHSILFASQYGLFVYDCRKKKVFYPEGDRPGALFKCRNMKFNSVFRDRRGWFWLGTHDGLNLYIPEKKKFYSYYQEDGLPNNIIQTVTEGTEKNIIYAATSNGLSLLTIDSWADNPVSNIQNLDSENGLLRGEYFERSSCLMPDGTLYFGGINGISILTPEMLREKGRSYTPMFSALKIADKEIETDDPKNLLKKALAFTRHLELPYSQNTFTLEFAAPHYANPELTRYRYRLLGSENENWTTVPSRKGLGSITFRALPPGDYRLEVEAASFNQPWCKEPATLEISVHSPFYWNPVAQLVYLLAIFGIGYYIFQIRRRERILLHALALQEERNDIESETASPDTQQNPQPRPTFDPKDLHLTSHDEKFMQRVLELLEKNMDNPDYGVEELSSQIGMVRVTLYRKLKSITGQTPVVFIRTLRLKRAAQYLKAGESVVNVTDRVGFSDAQYFRKCFKEMYGVNPKTYQEEQNTPKELPQE